MGKKSKMEKKQAKLNQKTNLKKYNPPPTTTTTNKNNKQWQKVILSNCPKPCSLEIGLPNSTNLSNHSNKIFLQYKITLHCKRI
jgi:hypothetical protein